MNRYLKSLGNGKHSVICPWDEFHTSGSHGDGSTVIFDGFEGSNFGFKCFHSHCAGKSVKDVLKFFNVKSEKQPVKEKQFHFTKLRQLFDEPEEVTRYLLEGMLPSGGLSVLAAKPKAGKTTFSSQLALAVARGDVFLNRQTQKGVVLHLAVEEKRSELKKRYSDLGANGDEEIYVHASSAPQNAIEKLKTIVKESKPVFVIIDTLFRVIPVENGNDYSEVTKELDPLIDLARESGAHFMLVHHMNKQEGGGEGSNILGSTAIQGSVDTMILLNRTKTHRTIKTIQRYGSELEETILVFNSETKQTSLGHSKLVNSAMEVEGLILELLRVSKGMLCANEVRDQLAIKNDTALTALKSLTLSGRVLRSGTGKKNDPYKYSDNPSF